MRKEVVILVVSLFLVGIIAIATNLYLNEGLSSLGKTYVGASVYETVSSDDTTTEVESN